MGYGDLVLFSSAPPPGLTKAGFDDTMGENICESEYEKMKDTKLFAVLPPYISTPDGMAVDSEGNLVLSCPNFADDSQSGVMVKITPTAEVTHWFDVPVHPETGKARNMGIAFDDEGYLYVCDNQGWSEREDLIFKGRVLKIKADKEGNILSCVTIATGMEHPNGVRYKDGYIYVTQSYMHPVKREDGKLTSGVYRFAVDECNVEVKNDLTDANLFCTFVTENLDCQYGVDGIVFDEKGDLYIGNFGDGAVWRVVLDENGDVKEKILVAKDPGQLQSTDGMCFDDKGNLYIADFSANALGMVTAEGDLVRVAASPDTDGLQGELNQPGEPIFYNNKIVVSCFNLVTGPDKVNTSHTMPCTLAYLELTK